MIAQGAPKDWWTAAELAAAKLPGLPTAKRKINELAQRQGWAFEVDGAGLPLARPRQGRGGGLEYHRKLLPPAALAALVKRGLSVPAEVAPVIETPRDQLMTWFERQTDKVRGEAARRRDALAAIDELTAAGHTTTAAVAIVAARHGVGAATLYEWRKLVRGAPRSEWLPRLAPQRQGCTTEAEIDPEAWRLFRSDYLRPEKPTWSSCWHRLNNDWAKPRGLTLPHVKTFQRRLEREVNPLVLARLRGGAETLRRSLPALQRTVMDLRALEAVNIDGHEWDVRVDFGPGADGKRDIARPMMVAIQDVYSRKILAWKIGRSESAALVQLTFAELFRRWGIPAHCVFDNGRAFASKWITGGAPYRFRGQDLPGDPLGLMASLGIEVHWTTPFRGQSKPIERAFGDLERHVGTHPAFAGAYTGRSTQHKPENYGARAVPIEQFREVVDKGIADHNARTGRRTEAAAGDSFDQAFNASYGASTITRATEADLRMALLPADKVRADARTGQVKLFGNVYWSQALLDHAGKPLVARFDPDRLHDDVHLYDRASGVFLCTAEVWDPAGFFDVAGAKRKARLDSNARRLAREAIEAQQLAEAADVAAAYRGDGQPLETPRPAAVRPRRVRGAAALKVATTTNPLIDRLDLDRLAPERAERPALRIVE